MLNKNNLLLLKTLIFPDKITIEVLFALKFIFVFRIYTYKESYGYYKFYRCNYPQKYFPALLRKVTSYHINIVQAFLPDLGTDDSVQAYKALVCFSCLRRSSLSQIKWSLIDSIGWECSFSLSVVRLSRLIGSLKNSWSEIMTSVLSYCPNKQESPRPVLKSGVPSIWDLIWLLSFANRVFFSLLPGCDLVSENNTARLILTRKITISQGNLRC